MKQVLGSAAFHSKEPVPVLQCEMKQEPVPVFLSPCPTREGNNEIGFVSRMRYEAVGWTSAA